MQVVQVFGLNLSDTIFEWIPTNSLSLVFSDRGRVYLKYCSYHAVL